MVHLACIGVAPPKIFKHLITSYEKKINIYVDFPYRIKNRLYAILFIHINSNMIYTVIHQCQFMTLSS